MLLLNVVKSLTLRIVLVLGISLFRKVAIFFKSMSDAITKISLNGIEYRCVDLNLRGYMDSLMVISSNSSEYFSLNVGAKKVVTVSAPTVENFTPVGPLYSYCNNTSILTVPRFWNRTTKSIDIDVYRLVDIGGATNVNVVVYFLYHRCGLNKGYE